jgi:curved DNA-binding protein CbpA
MAIGRQVARKDYYAILGVTDSITYQELKSVYRKLALQYHPDRNRGNAVAEAKFKEINEAFSVLSNNERRLRYDSERRRAAEALRRAQTQRDIRSFDEQISRIKAQKETESLGLDFALGMLRNGPLVPGDADRIAAQAWAQVKDPADPPFEKCAEEHRWNLAYKVQGVHQFGTASDEFEKAVLAILDGAARKSIDRR